MSYSVVEIEWLDAVLRSGADDAEKHARLGLMRRVSVGYLIGKTRKQLALAMTDDGDGRVDDVLTVPLAWVKKVRYLRKGRKR